MRNRRPKRQVVDEMKGSSPWSRGESGGWRVDQEDVERKVGIQQGRQDDKRLQGRGETCRISKIFETMLGYEQRAKVCCASEVFSCEV